MPTGGAVLFAPEATARGLGLPVIGQAGAIVSPREAGRAQGQFKPGATAELHSRDSRVRVKLPSRAHKRTLTIEHTPKAEKLPALRARGLPIPPDVAGWKRGFGTFYLDATDDTGADIHQFDAPLSISVSYTPEQLAALQIAEDALTLFWFDETAQRWVPLPTTVDQATRTATAMVDHFSPFQLADGSSPSTTFIPSLQGWQVSQLTGAATYGFPIDVPTGAGGLKPQLNLSYSSASSDGTALAKRQSSWVGKGWDLTVPYVALNKRSGADSDYYSLVLNGQSSNIVRGGQLTSTPFSINYLKGWYWYPTDENFLKVRYDEPGPDKRGTWLVWGKDGTKYEFGEVAMWGMGSCEEGVTVEPYKWMLTRVTDVHLNTMTFTYQRLTHQRSCGVVVDPVIWPTAIEWGGRFNDPAAPARYRVEFISSPRRSDGSTNVAAGEDMEWDYADSQYGVQLGAPHETQKLNAIKVLSKPAAGWELIRQYNFAYDFSLYSDSYVCQVGPCSDNGGTFGPDPAYRKLTLRSITRVGKDGTSALPSLSFSYQMNRGTLKRANGGWNRLQTVDNNQGGTVTFSYEHLAQFYYAQGRNYYNLFFNRHRVTGKTVNDGRGSSSLTTYSYDQAGPAAMNSLGTDLGAIASNYHPNSASLYYSNANNALGAHAGGDRKEFRGHPLVIERIYDGATTATPLLAWSEHYFYQGDVGCTPGSTSDGCFASLRERELMKGREWKTVWKNQAGGTIKETVRTFAVAAPSNAAGIDYTSMPTRGLWRAFTYARETLDYLYEGNSTPLTEKTVYTYDPAYQTGSSQNTHFGNLGRVDVYDVSGALYRSTRHWYATRYVETWDWSQPKPYSVRYIVDRTSADQTDDGQGRLLALALLFYDGANTTATAIGDEGELTRVSNYSDLPLTVGAVGVPLHSQDITYIYDRFGNPTEVTTYAGQGTAVYNGSWSIGAPGGGSAARKTTTEYDNPATTSIDEAYSGLPWRVTNPAGHVERGDYDYRMGWLTSVTDPNNNVTSAQYDVFGRLTQMIKPGATTSDPTTRITYYDTEQPVRYLVQEWIGNTGDYVRETGHFYDGLGREIQTKRESGAHGTQNVVTDRRYDGLDRVEEQSQPRYVDETGSAFWGYTAPGATLYRPTSTSYDLLGRQTRVSLPDGSATRWGYWLGGEGTAVGVYDANNHIVVQDHDIFGRLKRVYEYQGNNGSEGSYHDAVVASYFYDPLDQLVQINDAHGNQTHMTYDSLGRKTSMTDPDMGNWAYQYDANGNLIRQTDARGQRICFVYNSLGRMTGKHYRGDDTCPTNPTIHVAYYYDQGTNGKGLRTGIENWYRRILWQFDGRGRKTQADYRTNAGGTILNHTYRWAYNSADLVTAITYPNSDVLRYTYDQVWRQKTAYSDAIGTIVADATYTALDQPSTRRYGNNITDRWTYNHPLALLTHTEMGTNGNRDYTYDAVGNVKTIADNVWGQTQNFTYDHRDRLLHAWTTGNPGYPAEGGRPGMAYDQWHSYDALGNLLSKGGVTMQYGANLNGTGAGPHQVRSVNGQPYSYDANGNLLSGAGRSYTWNSENQLETVNSGGVVETYGYDPDGERAIRTRAGVSGVYVYEEGLWEELTSTGSWQLYPFNGQVVARRNVSSLATYLHGDHLGSMTWATNASGNAVGGQEYGPWGNVRAASGTSLTEPLNYTGQYLDGTGLLYYHARYYDPVLGRFISADSVVPGNASGDMDGVALKALTVDFHEPGFVGRLNDENGLPFWFQMSDEQRQGAGSPWGPMNPQALNRYSYVQNNPLNSTDPTGHVRHKTYLLLDPGKVNNFLALLSRKKDASAALAGGAIGVLGAVVCSALSAGTLMAVCGAAGAAITAAGVGALQDDYNEVNQYLIEAQGVVGANGAIRVYINEPVNSGGYGDPTVSITGYDENGKEVYSKSFKTSRAVTKDLRASAEETGVPYTTGDIPPAQILYDY